MENERPDTLYGERSDTEVWRQDIHDEGVLEVTSSDRKASFGVFSKACAECIEWTGDQVEGLAQVKGPHIFLNQCQAIRFPPVISTLFSAMSSIGWARSTPTTCAP